MFKKYIYIIIFFLSFSACGQNKVILFYHFVYIYYMLIYNFYKSYWNIILVKPDQQSHFDHGN